MGSALVLENDEIRKKIIGTLGFKEAGLRPNERGAGMLAFDAWIRKGIPYSRMRSVESALDLNDGQLAGFLGVSLRTFQRKRGSGKKLTLEESDRIFRMVKIFALAAKVLESEEMARRWLHKPQRGLGGKVPIETIRTEAGAEEVQDLLEKIEYGVLI
jgi:putative toxin-antitoxin system antitoxin component (TIGR02293 family)